MSHKSARIAAMSLSKILGGLRQRRLFFMGGSRCQFEAKPACKIGVLWNGKRQYRRSSVHHLLTSAIICCGAMTAFSPALAQTWTQTSAPTNVWRCVASSADGANLAAVNGKLSITGFLGPIYTSTNSGASWTLTTAPSNNWTCIASSADGTKLAATALDGRQIYTSTNSGATWIQTSAPSNYWRCIASSADGTKLAAGALYGLPIYISTNSGVTWTPSGSPGSNWTAIATSADGTKLAAVAILFTNALQPLGGCIYVSTNSGTTWALTTAPNYYWYRIASSADGTVLITGNADPNSDYVYLSRDSGVTWVQANLPSTLGFLSVASSADGKKLLAMDLQGNVYVSNNSGYGVFSWYSASNPYANNGLIWISIAMSADGNSLMAAAVNGGNYKLKTVLQPKLNLTSSSSNLALSWTIPSTNFVVQQSPDLISWSSVTDAPVLNLTNLNNELSLSPTNGSGFFRLMSQ